MECNGTRSTAPPHAERSGSAHELRNSLLPSARKFEVDPMAASFQGFRSLIENSPDAISLIDTRGEILYGSASTTRLFGYQPQELLGRNFLELIHPEDRDFFNDAATTEIYTLPLPDALPI